MEHTTKNSEVIDEIALRLADVFVKEVYQFYNHKSYSTYKKSLAEILHWAFEFSIEHQYKLKDLDVTDNSKTNLHKVSDPEDFLIVWGKERMALFLKQHRGKYLLMPHYHVKMYRTGAPPGLYVSI